MDKELIYKKIDNFVEQRKILWAIVTVLTGGTLGLLFNIISPFKLNVDFIVKFFIMIIGFFLDYVFMSSIWDNNKEINNLFNKLEKGV